MIQCYVDGAYQPKTQAGGIGIDIMEKNQATRLKYYLDYVPDNHVLEFLALRACLAYLKEARGRQAYPAILIHSDSKTVVDAVEKSYVKDSLYQVVLREIERDWVAFDQVYLRWIPEKSNKRADVLAKQALRNGVGVLPYPYALDQYW